MNLKVSEIFSSIQGESLFTGLPCTFVRLAGCNLKCRWCDSACAAAGDTAKEMNVSSVIETVMNMGMSFVCVTGGEPLLQPMTCELIRQLKYSKVFTTVETNGSLDWRTIPDDVPCIIDIKCPSSGMNKYNRLDLLASLRKSDQIKFVIDDHNDYQYARDIFRKYLDRFSGPVFVSPVAGNLNPVTLAKWLISDRIQMRLHLQIHKILNLK